MRAYLDNSATTRAFDEVAELVAKIMTEEYGNPSSVHHMGTVAGNRVFSAREMIAETLKVDPAEILFTSGGTESDNLALIGTARANAWRGKHIITTSVEHPAVLETCMELKKEGFEITMLPVDETGRVRLDDLKAALKKETILVSMMLVNNEIGAIEPLEEAGKVIKAFDPNIVFHVDAVQGFGKAVMPIKSANIDMLSFSGHKIHGPKGIGVLYVNEKVKIKPISYGGGQQKGLRNGTLNVPGIAGIGLAAKMINENLSEKREKLYELKSFFLQEISKVDKVSVNGCKQDASGEFLVKETAPHIINISVKGLRSEVMLHALEEKGIYVSAGSACSSHSKKESSTLKAMGASAEETDGALRISMSEFTTKEELETLIVELKAVIEKYGRFIRK